MPILLQARTHEPVAMVNAGNPSLYFIENKGQIIDQNRQQRKDIDFKISSGSLNIFIGDGQLHYQWNKLTNPEALNQPPTIFNKPASDNNVYVEKELRYDMYRMDVTLKGANTNATFIVEEQQEYYEQYYTEYIPDGATTHTYKKITYKNIYPNIDWVLYIKNNTLKYDFVVHAGGDASKIKLQYDGATDLQLVNGALLVTTPFGSITEGKPFTYDIHTKEEVSSAYNKSSESYIINGHLKSFIKYISFTTTQKDNIVIDPSLEWATYYGGSSADNSYAVVTDTLANVYMAGSTNNTSNIATTGAYQTSLAGGVDAMLVRFTEAGIRSFATYYGGTGNDDFFSATIDDNLNVYLAGTTSSTSGIATTGAHQSTYGGGGSDCFLVKLTPTGSRVWSTYYGGSDHEKTSTEYQVFVAADSSNNIYMVGNTRSTTGIATTGAHQATHGGNIDGYLVKFNTSGVRQWATYIGGNDNDNLRKIAFNSSGDVFVAGELRSSGFGTTGAHQASLSGNNDAYLVKFNGSGVRQWATYYGGSGSDSPQGLYTDYQGNVFMSGSTNSATGIVTSGAHQTSLNNGTSSSASDAYLVKFNSSGVRQWGTYYGGPNVDHSGDLMVDAIGYPAFTGTTSSIIGISTTGSHQPAQGGNGNFDALFAIFNGSGQLQWASYYGGSDHDYGYGINAAVGGIVYITGFTGSNNNMTQSGYQNSLAGAPDAFLAKFTPDTSAFIIQPFTDTVHCIGDTFTLYYGVTAPFYSNNSFKVQLSNASGSFASPVIIGTKTSNTQGSILCTIPGNTVAGTGYRVRVVTSNPVDTSFDNGNTIEIRPLPVKPTASSNSPVCDNETLNLGATTTTSGVTYSWTGPSGFFATTQNPTRTNLNNASAGDYIVSATLNGCSRKDTTTVTIINAPAKPTAIANTPICEGATLNLKSVSPTSGVSFIWDGANAFTSTQQNVPRTNITTADAGDYIISVTKNGCVSKDTINVQVIPLITVSPNIAVNPGTTVCPTTDLTFGIQNPPPNATYAWTGPNGFGSSSANPTLTNSKKVDSGYYKVVVSVNACSSGEDSIFVHITDTIQAPVLSSNTPVCEGDTLRVEAYTIYTGANVIFDWTEPKGAKLRGNFNKLTFFNAVDSNDGTYIVKLEVNGCTAYDTIDVTVKPTPPPPTITSNTPVCEGQSINFTASNTMSGVSYNWTGPSGFNNNAQNPTINNALGNNTGTYTATSVLNGCSSDPSTTSVVVNPNPSVQITGDATLCQNWGLVLSVAGLPTNYTYAWTGPDNYNGTSRDVNIASAQLVHAGRYIVEVTDLAGCKGKDTIDIDITALPGVPDAIVNKPVLCEGDSLVLNVIDTSSSDVSYFWKGNGGFQSSSKRTVITNMPLNYAGTFVVQVSRKGCTLSDSVDVTVKPSPPKPEATSNSPVNIGDQLNLKVLNPTVGTGYRWTGPLGFSSLAQDPIRTPVVSGMAGTYTVTATQNGCSTSSVVIVLVNDKAIPKQTLVLYPNPNNGEFSIQARNMPYDQEIAIEIVNEIGMVVYRGDAKSENLKLDKDINVNGILPSGVYIFRTILSGKTVAIKFSVVR